MGFQTIQSALNELRALKNNDITKEDIEKIIENKLSAA